MNDLARQELCEIVASYGRPICDNPQRCEALLRDLCAGYRGEVHALVSALKERVTADLLGSTGNAPKEVLLSRLTARLENDLALSAEAARWSVESWALALGVISPTELTQRRPTPGNIGGTFAAAGSASRMSSPTTTSVNGYSASSIGRQSPANTTSSPPAPSVRSQTRAGWIAAGVMAALTLAGGTMATMMVYQREQVTVARRRQVKEGMRTQQQYAAALQASKTKADAASQAATEPKEKLAGLALSKPRSVLSRQRAVIGGVDNPYAAARRLIRLDNDEGEIASRMMDQHRNARRSLERRYGPASAALDRAYIAYPYDDQIPALARMAAETSRDRNEVRALRLGPGDRDLLVRYFVAETELYREIGGALAYERDHDYIAAKNLWDAERQGVYVRASSLGDQVQTIFAP